MNHRQRFAEASAPRPYQQNAAVAEASQTLPPERCDRTEAAYFTPLHYEPNYAYPLIVWLHSPGADEHELVEVMQCVSLRNYVAAAPRGLASAAADRPGFDWPDDPRGTGEAHERIVRAIASALRRFHVARARIFVAGAGAGGTMALRFALDEPGLVAGAASLDGAFPRGRTLGRLHEARRLQVLLCSGCESEGNPPERVCADLRLLHAAGIPIVLRHYACGDVVTPGMLSDLDRWIMEQICPAPVLENQPQERTCDG